MYGTVLMRSILWGVFYTFLRSTGSRRSCAIRWFSFGGRPWHPNKNRSTSAGYAAIVYRSKDVRWMNTGGPCIRTATLQRCCYKEAILRKVRTPL